MTIEYKQQGKQSNHSPQSTLEQFLQAVEKRTNNPVHCRLLKVCRHTNPLGALEAELQMIVSEIINEA